MKERLDKYIASQTALSRKDASRAIRDKRVTVNGTVSRASDVKVDTDTDVITLDGQPLTYRRYVYYLMNKPAGVVSATEDKTERTVNDGDYAHRMLSPKKHVNKTYIATLDRDPGESISEAFRAGVTLSDGTVCQPGQAVCLGNNRVEVTIHEGKYHQVKRMFAALGFKVVSLERIRIGALTLDRELSPGEIRVLTGEEATLVFSEKS